VNEKCEMLKGEKSKVTIVTFLKWEEETNLAVSGEPSIAVEET
jgi:hypothetical protein